MHVIIFGAVYLFLLGIKFLSAKYGINRSSIVEGVLYTITSALNSSVSSDIRLTYARSVFYLQPPRMAERNLANARGFVATRKLSSSRCTLTLASHIFTRFAIRTYTADPRCFLPSPSLSFSRYILRIKFGGCCGNWNTVLKENVDESLAMSVSLCVCPLLAK